MRRIGEIRNIPLLRSDMTLRIATTAALAALLLGSAGVRAATVVEERTAAMEALRQQEITAYAFSTCRWIRRRTDVKLLERWRRDNADIAATAKRVVADQGGMTEARRKVLESLGAHEGALLSASPEACDALFEKTRSGARDLASVLPADTVRLLMQHRRMDEDGELWILEERRRPDGTLGKTARRYEGTGGIDACDEGAAAKGHVWTRGALGAAGAAVTASDPDLWLAECMRSGGDPITTAARSIPRHADAQ
jgi:hypothetical protein